MNPHSHNKEVILAGLGNKGTIVMEEKNSDLEDTVIEGMQKKTQRIKRLKKIEHLAT